VAVPGLSKAFPEVSCTDAGLCLMTTSMGYANAASSIWHCCSNLKMA